MNGVVLVFQIEVVQPAEHKWAPPLPIAAPVVPPVPPAAGSHAYSATLNPAPVPVPLMGSDMLVSVYAVVLAGRKMNTT